MRTNIQKKMRMRLTVLGQILQLEEELIIKDHKTAFSPYQWHH